MEARITVLSVSYDDVLRVTKEAILRDAGYEAVSAANLSQALEMLSAVHPACVILGHTVSLEDQVILVLAAEKITPRPRLDSTVAALAFNRVAQETFEKHDCTHATQTQNLL